MKKRKKSISQSEKEEEDEENASKAQEKIHNNHRNSNLVSNESFYAGHNLPPMIEKENDP